MKKILGSSVAAVAIMAATGAFAADLPVYVEPVEPAPVMDVVTYSFTGAWVGVQAGAVFGGDLDDLFDDDDEDDIEFDDIFDDDGDDTTWEAGVAAGFDWQMGNFVFGVLGDVNWVHELGRGSGFGTTYEVNVTGTDALDFEALDDGTETLEEATAEIIGGLDTLGLEFSPIDAVDEDVTESVDFDFADAVDDIDGIGDAALILDFDEGTITDTGTFSEELDWYATARGRAGFAAGRFMFYGTGGLAYGSVDTSASITRTYDEDATDLVFGPTGGISTTPGSIAEVEEDLDGFDDFDAIGDGDTVAPGCEVAGGGGAETVTCSYSASDDDDRFGYALGVGTEVLVTQSFSVGLEYLYVNLGEGDDLEFDGDVAELPGIEYDDMESEDFDFHTVKVRGAFRF